MIAVEPGLRLVAGDRRGQFSLRIHEKWRVRLAGRRTKYFGNSAQFWMNPQTDFELGTACEASVDGIYKEIRPHEAWKGKGW